ncbi:MAG: sulfatase [Chitinophagaceae bacterium]
MKQLLFILYVLIGVSALGQKKPNVIFIIVDDLRTDLNCYGNKQIISPNLDKLAAESLKFNKAYCQQAVCGPSRASFMTGQFPEKTGVLNIKTPFRKNNPTMASMPMLFKEAGYKTISVGKVYHIRTEDEEYWSYLSLRKTAGYVDPKTKSSISDKAVDDESLRGPPVEYADMPDKVYDDYIAVDEALNQLKETNGKPFLLCLGIAKPHLPFVAPKKYWDLYDRKEIATPNATPPIDASTYAGTNWGELRQYAGMPQGKTPLTIDQAMELKHGYYACVSFIDAQIGRFLDEVHKMGMDKNTVIVFVSDHGWKLGEYGLWTKHTNYELDTHVPMIIKTPAMKTGSVTNSIVQSADILPTLVELCKLRVTPMEGKSYAKLLGDQDVKIHDFAFSLFPRPGVMGYSLTDGNYRYTRWVNDKTHQTIDEEFYDHTKSDIATRNLHNDANFKTIEEKFSTAMDKLRPVINQ